jgi:hypothetical protein
MAGAVKRSPKPKPSNKFKAGLNRKKVTAFPAPKKKPRRK